MSDDAAEGLPALQQLLVDKFFLGLVHQLQGQFSNLGSAEVEDAVADAVEKLLKRLSQGPVRSVKDYLAKVAFNDLNRLAKSRVKEIGLGERDDQEAPSAEAGALRNAAIDIIKTEIRTWENAHIREVMLIYVDVMAYGEPLDTYEVADLASVVLGEDITPLSVRTWKARGLRKLHEFIDGAEGLDSPGQSERYGTR